MRTVSTATVQLGDALPPLDLVFTRESLVRYAGASGDFNPIHYSNFYADRVGLPGVIAHGMLTMGSALRIVTDWIGDPQLVRSYFVRFTRPVVVPDDDAGTIISVTASVIAVEDDVATVEVEAVCDGQKVLGMARANVQLPPGAGGPGAEAPVDQPVAGDAE